MDYSKILIKPTKIIYNIMFFMFLNVRLNKNRHFYFYEDDIDWINQFSLIPAFMIISYCLWNHDMQKLLIFSMILLVFYIVFYNIKKNINALLKNMIISVLNSKFHTNNFQVSSYDKSIMYANDYIIMPNGIYNNQREDAILIFDNSGVL